MRILLVCQHYAPEPFRVSDLAEGLVERGHEVTVVTGLPNYPEGKVLPEFRRGKRRCEDVGGVHVHRCSLVGRRHGILFRMLNYYSFVSSSKRRVGKLKNEAFDCVLVYQLSPVMMAEAAVKYKRLHPHVPLVFYTLDLWPESLAIGGIKRTSPVFRYYHHVSKRLYAAADKILLSSAGFAEYFEREFGITENTAYLPQYAEELFTADSCSHVRGDGFDFVFAGNIGSAQSVETIIGAAARLRDVPDLRFHIVGDGISLHDCKRLAEELRLGDSVFFHGRHPAAEMPTYYGMADAMIVTLSDNVQISRTLPGKVQSYLAAGKPILAAAGGETRRVVQDSECGFAVPSEDAEGLASVVRRFIALSDEEREGLGRNARAYYEEHFSRERFLDRMEEHLGACCARNADADVQEAVT